MRYGLLCLLVFSSCRAFAAERPNIVFSFADDQTTSVLGCSGHPTVQTPNIDLLADGGVRFQNAFVSQSICWVSRTSILTGLTARSYGTPDNPDQTRADAARTLYTDLLREHGYRTGFFGKWHAKMPPGYKPADHFDRRIGAWKPFTSTSPYATVSPLGKVCGTNNTNTPATSITTTSSCTT